MTEHRLADSLIATIRERMAREGVAISAPAGEEPESFYPLATGWLVGALESAEAALATALARQTEPVAVPMTAEDATKSEYWDCIEYDVTFNKEKDLIVSFKLVPLTLSLEMPEDQRVQYKSAKTSVHQRVMEYLSSNMTELVTVASFKLVVSLRQSGLRT